jgi:L-fuculokinase
LLKKKNQVLLFDEQYKVLHEESTQLEETVDEDGFPCEDVNLLTKWLKQKFSEILLRKDMDVKAVNFSAYGASFVNIDRKGNVITPLYNYLKPFPDQLKKKFYDTYGEENLIAKQTASPVLGSLNSGMQLYRLKYEKPEVYQKIEYSLHLPQYLSFIVSKNPTSDISSVGCHTNLWDFKNSNYHRWVFEENLDKKLAPLYNGNKVIGTINDKLPAGIGLHDSSAALIPYLSSFQEPFVLISTGTWNISLNPFNDRELTRKELQQDCLCYLSYEGKPVKASRLFAGHEHEQEIKRIADHFNRPADSYQTVEYNRTLTNDLNTTNEISQPSFSKTDLHEFKTYEEAYHHLILNIVQQQVKSTNLVLQKVPVKKIFVDGGFGKNEIFMNMLAKAFPDLEVYAATIPQASALGAALAIHQNWNNNPLPDNMIELKHYTNTEMNYSV